MWSKGLALPDCGPEPGYYETVPGFGKMKSRDYSAWQMCRLDSEQSAIPKGASPGVWTPEGKPFDSTFHSTAYDVNYTGTIAIVFLLVCIIIAITLTWKKHNEQSASDDSTVYPDDTVNGSGSIRN